ncbi:MAG: alpha/beta fold hydrolase [Candidatus Rokubacteria bacterium]|nr:alpha/beta fold hydrolase [Candidatus Rokubacteria bacterium]
MIAWHGRVPPNSGQPEIVFVHGAANSRGVWALWERYCETAGWATYALDLRGHGESTWADLATATMDDYVQDVHALASRLARPPVLVGWSMGGLVTLMYVSRYPARGAVLLGPSLPANLRQRASPRPLEDGTYGPEVYGIVDKNAPRQPTMPDLTPEETGIALRSLSQESTRARTQRERGIGVPPDRVSCPLMVVAGTRDDLFSPSTCRAFAEMYNASPMEFEGASHWGLVLNERALVARFPDVARWVVALYNH